MRQVSKESVRFYDTLCHTEANVLQNAIFHAMIYMYKTGLASLSSVGRDVYSQSIPVNDEDIN